MGWGTEGTRCGPEGGGALGTELAEIRSGSSPGPSGDGENAALPSFPSSALTNPTTQALRAC